MLKDLIRFDGGVHFLPVREIMQLAYLKSISYLITAGRGCPDRALPRPATGATPGSLAVIDFKLGSSRTGIDGGHGVLDKVAA